MSANRNKSSSPSPQPDKKHLSAFRLQNRLKGKPVPPTADNQAINADIKANSAEVETNQTVAAAAKNVAHVPSPSANAKAKVGSFRKPGNMLKKSKNSGKSKGEYYNKSDSPKKTEKGLPALLDNKDALKLEEAAEVAKPVPTAADTKPEANEETRQKAAIKIQAFFRGKAQRKNYLRKIKDIIKVEALARGFLARKHFSEMKKKNDCVVCKVRDESMKVVEPENDAPSKQLEAIQSNPQ